MGTRVPVVLDVLVGAADDLLGVGLHISPPSLDRGVLGVVGRDQVGAVATAEQPRQEDDRGDHEQADQTTSADLATRDRQPPAAAQAGEREPSSAALAATVLDPAAVGAADPRHRAPLTSLRVRRAAAVARPTPDPHRAGSDQRRPVAESRRRDPRLPAVRQAGGRAELLLGGVEERRGEAEGDPAADDDEVEVEQVAHRRRRPADEPSGALHDLVRRFGRRAPGDRLDRQPGRLGLEAAARAASAAPAVGVDDEVADVAGVGRRAVEQLAVEDDAAADAGRHAHHAVVVVALGGAHPALGEGQRLAVEVAVHPLRRQLAQSLAERELPPRRRG